MKKITLFVFAAIIAVVALSCCPCRKSTSSTDWNLSSTSWQLTQINGRSVKPQEEQYTLRLSAQGEVSGVAQCNRIMGSYTFDADRALKFDHMGMTRMMCPGPEFEDEYGRMLGEVTHYEVDGDMLIMLSNGSTVALFQKVDGQ
ncbi:MAG: META domain-containing protein [Rikenellaceae bacterium]